MPEAKQDRRRTVFRITDEKKAQYIAALRTGATHKGACVQADMKCAAVEIVRTLSDEFDAACKAAEAEGKAKRTAVPAPKAAPKPKAKAKAKPKVK